jgi:hypothetical protein
MEQNTKIIIAAIGLGGLGYFLYKKGLFGKNAATMPNLPIMPNVVTKPTEPPIVLPSTDGTANQYPIAAVVTSSQEGRQPTGQKVRLKDGDAVKGVPETVYVLKGGEKHPVSGAWWFYNFGQDWSNLINVTDETLGFIPTGSTYTINGQ